MAPRLMHQLTQKEEKNVGQITQFYQTKVVDGKIISLIAGKG